MPCSSEGFESHYAHLYKQELDKVTDLLCQLCQANESGDIHFAPSPALAEWWKKHQELDARRRAEEANRKRREEDKKVIAKLRADILARLTPTERFALGLTE